jgi:hypothetical protein
MAFLTQSCNTWGCRYGKNPLLNLDEKNVFYFRIRIPAGYQELLKAREIVQSLKTEKQAEAIPLALQLAAHYKSSLQD